MDAMFLQIFKMLVLRCSKQLNECIISLIGEGLAHKTSLTLPRFIYKCLYQARVVNDHVYVVLVTISLYTIFRLDFGAVPTVWYFISFLLKQIYQRYHFSRINLPEISF